MYGESKYFIKPFTRLEISSIIQNNNQKILQKTQFYKFRLVESYFQLIECSFRSIEQESNNDRIIQRLQDRFPYHFNRSSKSFDQSKILNFNFSLRKFQNLNFHFIDFMKQYSANSNIIITTYSCIYLYIQHGVVSKLIIN